MFTTPHITTQKAPLMTHRTPVFVYGTLRSGLGNYAWALHGKTTREQPAVLTGAVMHDNGGFPFVTTTDATPDNIVLGDLMDIDPALYDDVMSSLDSLEGFIAPGYLGNMYERALVTVTTEDGTDVEAYTYLVAPHLYQRRVQHLPVIDSGDWIAHNAARSLTRASAYGW